MPYTYLHPTQHTAPTGVFSIDAALKTLRAATGQDYRVARYNVPRLFRKPLPMFGIFSPTSSPYEFGIEDFNGQLRLHAPEEIALSFLEGLHWGALDERYRMREKWRSQGNWVRDWIAERRKLSQCSELTAQETISLNFFLDELEAAYSRAANR